jgi:hypothetical protein
MSFMEVQKTTKLDWFELDGNHGIQWLPADDAPELAGLDVETARKYYDGTKVWGIEAVQGWGVRLSAPGYLDCTDWAVFDTEAEADAAVTELEAEQSEGDDDGDNETDQ